MTKFESTRAEYLNNLNNMTKKELEKHLDELFDEPRGFWGWYYDLYFSIENKWLTFLEKIGLYKQK